ncbi:MAG: 50S ribosomal protein L29 [Chlamydiia bacterium]
MAEIQSNQELRALSHDDLVMLAASLERQSFQMRNQRMRDGRMANAALARNVRRQRARVLTIISEKQQTRGSDVRA